MTPERYATWKASRQRWIEKVRALIRDEKRVPCKDCGGTFDPVCMDFDHRPGEVKLFTISHWGTSSKHTTNNPKSRANGNGAGISRIVAEMAKCDIVCANCHRLRTARRSGRQTDDVYTTAPE